MTQHFSFESPLAKKILRALRKLKSREKLEDLGQVLGVKIWSSLSDLDKSVEEIHHQIGLLPNLNTAIHASIAVKFYIVSWCTLSDILAGFINTALNLGINKKDINFTMILRNEHVQRTRLPEIIQKYRKEIDFSRYTELRNEIVHRGILNDTELLTITNKLHEIDMKGQIFGTPLANERSKVQMELEKYLLRKGDDFTTHISNTVAMLDEITAHIARSLTESRLLKAIK